MFLFKTLGQPISLGQSTILLTDKSKSIQQIALEKEKELFELTHPSKVNLNSTSDFMQNTKDTKTPAKSSKWSTVQNTSTKNNDQTKMNYRYFQSSHPSGPLETEGATERAGRSKAKSSLAVPSTSTTYAATEWNKLISSLSIPMKNRNKLADRERPWPVPKKEFFHTKYSWLAQPMVKDAAEQIYSKEIEEKEQLQQEIDRRLKLEEREKKKKVPLLKRVEKYNSKQPSSIHTLKDLKQFEKEINLKIREQRLNAEPIVHPYGWTVPSTIEHPSIG